MKRFMVIQRPGGHRKKTRQGAGNGTKKIGLKLYRGQGGKKRRKR